MAATGWFQPDGSEPAQSNSAVAVARFHIHPSINIRQHSAHEVYLSAPDGEVWLFTCRDAGVSVEEDIFFADPSGVRKSSQLAAHLRGGLAAGNPVDCSREG